MSIFDQKEPESGLMEVDQSSDAGIQGYLLSKRSMDGEIARQTVSQHVGLAELRESDPDSYRLVMYGWA